MPDSSEAGTEQADKLHRSYVVLSQEEILAWLASEDGLPRKSISTAFRAAERELLSNEVEQEGGAICGDHDAMEKLNDDP